MDGDAKAPDAPPRRRRRWGRGLLLLLFGVGVLLGGLGVGLARSGRGQRLMLDAVLDRARSGLAGTLEVDSLRSPNLLGGATLMGLRLDAAGGRRFLVADSVRLRYSLLSLLGAAPRIAAVTLFGARVQISRYHGEEDMNVAHLVVRAEPTADSAPAGPGLAVGSIRVVDGQLEVLTPLDGPAPERVPTVVGPDGDGRLRRLALERVALELEDVRLGGAGGDLLAGRVRELAMDVSLLDRPLRVAGLEGRVRFGEEGLVVEDGALRLPASAFDAGLSLGPAAGDGSGWGFRLDLRTRGPAALADLAWLDDRIPDGVFRGGIGVSVAEGLDVDLRDLRVELEASRLAADGGVRVADGVALRDLRIEGSPLALSRLEPWVGRLPLDGWLSGRVRLSGRPGALSADGRVTLVPTGYGGLPTTADFRGTLHLGRDPGATNLRVVLDPLSFEALGALGAAVRLTGTGGVEVRASGRVDEGIRFVADARRGAERGAPSRILAQGSALRAAAGDWVVDVQADLAPLSLDFLRDVTPALALAGEVSGGVRAVGPLRDLRVHGDLAAAGGTVAVEGTVDALDPGRGYRLGTRVDGVRLSRVFTELPDPSTWTGRLEVEGRGLRPDSLEARARVVATGSRLGGLHVDTLSAEVRASDGMLRVDTLTAVLGGLLVEGAGGVGMIAGARGEAHLAFRTDDLLGLRPLLLGDTVMAGDTLSVLEREALRLQGVDVEGLPDSADVAMSGVLEGEMTLTGTLADLDVTGSARLRQAVYGRDRVDRADVRVDARRATAPERTVGLIVDAADLTAYGRSFREVRADVRLEGRRGEGSVAMERDGGDRYTVSGAFALDSVGGGEVHLEDASMDVDSLAWRLVRPTLVTWDSTSVTLREVEVSREGEDPMRLTARGLLDWRGSSDLRVEARGLHLDRVARVAELEALKLGGHMDLALDVTGPAPAPVIRGSFSVEDPRYRDLALSRIAGEIAYADRSAELTVEAHEGARRVFRAAGTVPVDLALRPEGRRIVPRPMDVRVEADSLDASVALGTLSVLEDVDGVVSGEFRIRGTLDRPEPSGVLRLEGAAWSIEALEVRHEGVAGTLTLNPDRTVDVEVDARANGASQVRGRIVLDPLSNPRLDLTVSFLDFDAVHRRDIEGHISGEVRLLGSYRSPRVEGSLTVDHGTLFLEEFARSATVVDLTDPRIFDVVDTTVLSTRPLLAGIRNPFLQNLRVDVDLSVPRDTWLRSADMNVEMGGDLLVRYDRLRRDVVMVGELQALRGSYSVLGRRFEVRGGTVGFIGTPGVNPTLDIQAVTRLRQVEGGMEVAATVEGTLTQPRVTLSSTEQGLAESDLVSYLIFGRPSYELATGDEAFLTGAAGSVVGAATGAGVTYVTGTLATRLGAALSQQIGIDYLSISQAGDFGILSGSFAGSLAGTQVELGQYVGADVFFVLIFRPLSGQTTGQGFFGGVRVEVALTDDYNVQGFWEDRFLRSRVGGFGDQGFQASQVVGVFIFREWGY